MINPLSDLHPDRASDDETERQVCLDLNGMKQQNVEMEGLDQNQGREIESSTVFVSLFSRLVGYT